jgi:ribosomal protein L7/L12
MSDNPFAIQGNNVNAYRLVQSIQLLIDTKQWNEISRFTACNDPDAFIKSVDSFRESDTVTKLLEPEVVDLWITEYDASSKIPVIKELRVVFGIGLSDAKDLCEAAPVKILEAKIDSLELSYVISRLKPTSARLMLRTHDKSAKCDSRALTCPVYPDPSFKMIFRDLQLDKIL